MKVSLHNLRRAVIILCIIEELVPGRSNTGENLMFLIPFIIEISIMVVKQHLN